MRKDKQEKSAHKSNLKDALWSDPPHLEFISNKEVVIEGSRGVLLYSETLIRINTGSMMISFCGRGLNLRCISPTALIIEGFITNVEFAV